jgi:hypothetical protein
LSDGNSSNDRINLLSGCRNWTQADRHCAQGADREEDFPLTCCSRTRRIKFVLVLERWGCVGEVLEYCAKSELHPGTAGLPVLKAHRVDR